MSENPKSCDLIRFAVFELDLEAGELRKNGRRLKFSGQPLQVLAILMENPGKLVTREQLQQRLWPDTFVDVDHSLNTAINKIREVLGDSAESPRFVETVPRRGYRFLASIEAAGSANPPTEPAAVEKQVRPHAKRLRLLVALTILLVALVAASAYQVFSRKSVSAPRQHALTRLTFDDGLQTGATWSPDGRFIAYSSDRGGKFDVWVRLVSGGNPVQITKGAGNNWQPDWSPDGQNIVYRSEDGGGLFVIPALGGEEHARKITSFGYYPRWSPDGSQILFRTHLSVLGVTNRFFVVNANGGEPREVFADVLARDGLFADAAAWHPDGKRLTVMTNGEAEGYINLWTVTLSDGTKVRSKVVPEVAKQIAEVLSLNGREATQTAKLSWSPGGDALYCDLIYRGVRNLWKMTINPTDLSVIAAQRLTTGAGSDAQPALSSDGQKLAFTTQNRRVGAWLYPFDASSGKITGPGKVVTPSGVVAWLPNLSRDGKKLIYDAVSGDKAELRQKILPDGEETVLRLSSEFGGCPVWSPDGTRIVYRTFLGSSRKAHLVVWSSINLEEQSIGPMVDTPLDLEPYDWAPNGQSVLASIGDPKRHEPDIWQVPVRAPERDSQTKAEAQKITSAPPGSSLYQGHFSPNGRWIVFIACKNGPSFECTLFVMPSAGGKWTNLSEGHFFDDKPRWSPDGKMLYYVSGRAGVYNVRGVRFDPVKGDKIGDSFPVTSFTPPGPVIANDINSVELTLSQASLVITLEESPGSIWMLDNVDR